MDGQTQAHVRCTKDPLTQEGAEERERGKGGREGKEKKQNLVRVENDNKLTSVASQLKASDRVKSK